jgi:LmbE family N-acetylglucosaminyl deacetylase
VAEWDTEPERILLIVAHPDDIDFVAAGSIATWTKAGIEVTYCLVTSGDAGSEDRHRSRADIAAEREAEQTAAAAVVGVERLIFMRRPDGEVEANLDLRRALSRVIRQVRPDRIIGMSPEVNVDRIYAMHPDHLAVGAATLAAVYPDARNPMAFPELLDEGLEPWACPAVWLPTGPDVAEAARVHVDITDTIDLKVAALQAHVSQTGHRDGLGTMLRQWAASTALACGLPDGRFAEAFRRVDTR